MMKFSDYLQSNTPAVIYFDLPNLLEESKSKTTRLINKPERMTKEHIIKFSEILKISTRVLVEKFKCGYSRITQEEFEELKNHSLN